MEKESRILCPGRRQTDEYYRSADPAFSSKMLGDGFAVDLTDGEIGAPFDGEVTAAFPTGHAFGLKRKDGLECLIHRRMDTVQLNGKGFER